MDAPHTYTVSDWPLKTTVTIRGDLVLFEMSRFYNRWENEVQVHLLLPGRMGTTDGENRQWAMALGVILILIGVLVAVDGHVVASVTSCALGIVLTVLGLRHPVRRWVTLSTYMGETYSFLRGQNDQEFEAFCEALEVARNTARPSCAVRESKVSLLRRVRCPAEQVEAYRDIFSTFDPETYLATYCTVELIGQSSDGEFLERWTYFSENNRQACEEWLTETTSGKKFAAQWTELGVEASPFEVWIS